MDENALRDMLVRATREEPPMGRLSVNALREGTRLRRRRRVQGATTAAAAAAAVALVGIVPALTTHGKVVKVVKAVKVTAQATGYVAALPDRIVPVNLATDTAGKPIPVASMSYPGLTMAVAPNGRTLYVTSATGLVTPIDTATNEAGPPIDLHLGRLNGFTITPSGTIAYASANTGVDVVDLASGSAQVLTRTPSEGVVVAPNGKFAYVVSPHEVIPIRVATNTELKPIPVTNLSAIVFSPDGRTAYALSQNDKQRPGELIPISTTTNAVGTPIDLGFLAAYVVGVPHSAQAYVEEFPQGPIEPIVPVNLITRTVGTPIDADAVPGLPLTAAPDGKALYLFSIHGAHEVWKLTEISTARNAVVRNIPINGYWPDLFAISPDGSTGFVGTSPNANTAKNPTYRLVPVHLADNKFGRPIQFGHLEPVEMAFAR